MSNYYSCFNCAFYNGSTGYCSLHDTYCKPNNYCPDCKPMGQHYYSRDSYENRCCKYCWYRDSDGYCRKRSEYVSSDDSCIYFTAK